MIELFETSEVVELDDFEERVLVAHGKAKFVEDKKQPDLPVYEKKEFKTKEGGK